MAANFWASSQWNHWILTRQQLQESRKEDLKQVSEEHLGHLRIWYCSLMHRLGKRLHLRQQVIATALVFFKRFYSKNSFRGTDPNLVLTTCLYVACKVEECPQHIKTVVQEMKYISQDPSTSHSSIGSPSPSAGSSLGGFPYDNSKVAEMEFYLLEELDFYLVVYHPYRSLKNYTKQMKLEETTLQMAWFVINDTYRTELCLLYPPHLIALAALYMTLILNADHQAIPISDGQVDGGNDQDYNDMLLDSPALPSSSANPTASSTPQSTAQIVSANPYAQNASAPRSTEVKSGAALPTSMAQHSTMITFFASLNVPIESIIEITQEMLSLYELWSDFQESTIPFLLRKLGAGPLHAGAAPSSVSNFNGTKANVGLGVMNAGASAGMAGSNRSTPMQT